MPRLERMTPALVFVVSLAVLWWNAAPSVTFHDSGELALAAMSAGIPHPPGMPTWTALASLFVRLGGFEDAARGTNLFSGLCAAVSLGLLSMLTIQWSRRFWPGAGPRAVAAGALLAPLVLLHSSAFLEQSFITEQYTLMVLLIALMLWVATALFPAVGAGDSPPARHGRKLLFALGALWGLAIGNHLSQLAMGLLVVWAGVMHAGGVRRVRVVLAAAAPAFAGWMCGLMIFLWLPIRSAANPIMDWGYIRNWDNFVFAVTRRQWPTRPISAAPRGYVHEWLITYDFLGQMGVAGFILALLGLLLLIRHGKVFLGWLASATIPYAAGMLLGHMREEGKNIGYIRHYGVTDWHLPIYFAGSLAAGVALVFVIQAVRSSRGARAARGTGIALLLLTAGLAARSVHSASLRNFEAPDKLIADLLAPIPDDAIVAVVSDNCANMLNYVRHGRDGNSRRFVVYALMQLPDRIQNILDHGDEWNEAQRLEYLQNVMMRPLFQPIRVEPPSRERALTARIFVDRVSPHPKACPYLIPAGLLYEARMEPATPEEIRRIDAENRERFPQFFLPPDHTPHRLEAEARGLMHQERGLYFMILQLWPEAEAALELAMAWVPENGELWFRLGTVQEELGKPERAAESYRNAIVLAEFLPEVRNNLGILHAARGEFETAIEHFQAELDLFPGSENARANLERARRDAAAAAGGEE